MSKETIEIWAPLEKLEIQFSRSIVVRLNNEDMTSAYSRIESSYDKVDLPLRHHRTRYT